MQVSPLRQRGGAAGIKGSGDRGQAGERHGDLRFIVGVIFKFSGVVVGICLHIEIPMPAQVKENGAGYPFLFTLHGLSDCTFDGMVGLRRRHDAFGARECHAGIKALGLGISGWCDLTQIDQLTDQRRHTVVAQSTGVGCRRHEGSRRTRPAAPVGFPGPTPRRGRPC